MTQLYELILGGRSLKHTVNKSEACVPELTPVMLDNQSGCEKIDGPPKHFAVDLDDTYYTNDEESYRKNLLAFAKAKSLGYVLFFCTGRTRKSALLYLGDEFVEKTGYNGFPGIYCNGAVTYDDEGNVLHHRQFQKKTLKMIYDYLLENDLLSISIFHDDAYFYRLTDASDVVNAYIKREGHPETVFITYEKMIDMPIVGFVIFVSEFNVPGLVVEVDYVRKSGRSGFLMITPPGVIKANALKVLMNHYKEPPSNCGFIGDSDNDIEAMKLSNYSFAVGNAPDHVKGFAKYVTDVTCNDAAFAHIMKIVYGICI